MTSRKVAQSIGKPTASPHTQGNEALAEFHSHVTRHEPFPDGHNQAFKTVLISLHQKWWLNIYYTTTHLKKSLPATHHQLSSSKGNILQI